MSESNTAAHEAPKGPHTFTFAGGTEGGWRVRSQQVWRGANIVEAQSVGIVDERAENVPTKAAWQLRGVVSNLRYTTNRDRQTLSGRQPGLGRTEAVFAAIIPIRKSAAWWDLAQDERRQVFEETSKHTSIGLDYLPAIARRLFHSRDLGEPFDFLTWFEFAPENEPRFDDLLARLRATLEWTFVEREIDIRLVNSSVSQA
ncbi:chlorite dismutase family protein [Methylobacterium gnaphalii]|uniref:Chlorite dismutase n=1 Tax=Methylobacterium gnaphalii TaxID=1010610 RepID=A0A512JRQ5_9HYPH|nr:chlorite dismutase family protein [Methylobacterium gnaphalii]GEP12625.1 hypothetical protein MGN01_44700 [Methylobacterium gnaphalii]GJD71713.1 hypothetical protein MMMDOFMJ_4676 [Methylobacterium gnaphalii]GLS48882.1 hypothetical protein GCM10007885_17290 [Methylobacterium gnaphalii]